VIKQLQRQKRLFSFQNEQFLYSWLMFN